jgi:glutamyl-tRNA synthetase
LHLGHYRTFQTAWRRARAAGGRLILRIEDLDPVRCRKSFAQAAMEDLRWAGLDWDEGPDVGGAFAPYEQSQRTALHRAAFARLKAAGAVFRCVCSRRDVATAASAPHSEDSEPIYPGTCRERALRTLSGPATWRFRVPQGEAVSFVDARMGPQTFVAGRDFGDFIVWRRDDAPAYELAVVVDDAAMRITEVVRGQDLLLSTARQLLLYRALALQAPAFYHCALVTDCAGKRLAKRDDAASLRELRLRGMQPNELDSFALTAQIR